MLGDLAGDHLGWVVEVTVDTDEGDTVGAGDSTKAHSDEPSDGRGRGAAGRGGPSRSTPLTAASAAQPGVARRRERGAAGTRLRATTQVVPVIFPAVCK